MRKSSDGVRNLALIKETSEGAITVEFSDMTDEELMQRIIFPDAVAELVRRQDKESRASNLSKVERRIVKDSIHCKECQENNDPNNVPVHPHCQCNVITDSVEAGVADHTNRMFQPLTPDSIAMEIFGDIPLPDGIQLDPATTAVIDGNTARFADLARWLEQMEPYLQQGANYLSIVVDDDTDEAVQQVEETINEISEDIENLPEALRSRKLWFSLAKSVVF